MAHADLLIYAAHLAFWAAFGLTRALTARGRTPAAAPEAGSAVAQSEVTAPWSRALLALHMLAFGLMYFGLGAAVIPQQVPEWFAGQRIVGAGVIALGAALACWAVASFASWRFRAKVEAGHALATMGAFAWLRHPIYMALNLLALGSAIWVPTPLVWAGAVLMLVGSDLRARAEERLLPQAFGAAYTAYCARTPRFVPGVY